MREKFLREVLDTIERREARLLVWGLANARLTQPELDNLINPMLDEVIDNGLYDFIESKDVVDALERRGLLFLANRDGDSGFRSRMAETVRLLFHLRQLLPRHVPPDGWQQARTLVADYRFLWRKRRRPEWILSKNEATKKFDVLKDSKTKSALTHLLDGRGGDFRLANFQVEATIRILENLGTTYSTGTLISAGTGSGKTLAFYLPAIARTAQILVNESRQQNWVKILAIYPRIELLRDQFAAVYSEARRLDQFLRSESCRRKIRIGLLFGDVPRNWESLQKKGWAEEHGWQSTTNGYICPFMPCPESGCGGELAWVGNNQGKPREILTCVDCDYEIGEDELLFTRDAMERSPPDIFFTTTEMLNQRFSDSGTRRLFGLGVRPPELVLLDEIHTYSGMPGAQVAYLLRRWLHLVRRRVCFVGLSATLRDGARFFASLTGIEESQVAEITPKQNELVEEGAEYLLALRGDPVSRASLLATTIQTAMLISRMLDRSGDLLSKGLYGHRVFGFTDTLDVTNRLFEDLLDAEGQNLFGQPNLRRHPNGGLAILRRPAPSDARECAGQNWSAPQFLGHKLEERKSVGRVSSQDQGVPRGKDIIIATSSLEVGFDDPDVGAVIQHKAPREMAQFVQRKGRAGRRPTMRPWMIVVLSEYGRDRIAYRNYEVLFDPELPVRYLPLSSRYIQRMQGVYVLFDYLGTKLQGKIKNYNVWRAMAGPDKYSKEKFRIDLIRILINLVSNPDQIDEFQEYLTGALKVSESDARSLLWEYPRPILSTVIPTALRRLDTHWQRGDEAGADFQVRNSPLPEFVPANLFSDLNLPEVQVVIPPEGRIRKSETKTMPIFQALKEFAPGRVSKRFGYRTQGSRHWVQPGDLNLAEQQIILNDSYDTEVLGQWDFQDGSRVNSISVYRPLEIRLALPSKSIANSSNARLIWETQIISMRPGCKLITPKDSVWDERLRMEIFSHADHSEVTVRRFAMESEADILYRDGSEQRTHVTFTQHGLDAALGFSVDVDAIRFCVSCPNEFLSGTQFSDETIRALRTRRFFDAAKSNEGLVPVDNPFTREWLAVIYLVALSHNASSGTISLSKADEVLATGTAEFDTNQVLETLFQSPWLNGEIDEEQEDDNNADRTDRLRQELEGYLRQNPVKEWLRRQATLLWAPIDSSWEPWLKTCYTSTVAGAVYEAIQTLCPEIDIDGLVVDLEGGPRTKGDVRDNETNWMEFWVSEKTPGGTGSIEAFQRVYMEDARRFCSLMSAALQSNEHEIIDDQLAKVLDGLVGPEPVAELVAVTKEFRGADGVEQVETAFTNVRRILSANKFALFHGFLSALSNRILRLGSNDESDDFLYKARDFWVKEEQRLGIELDLRTVAYLLSQKKHIDRVITSGGLSIPTENVQVWRFNTISGLLWDRGGDVRRAGVDLYNPFCPFGSLPSSERLLVAGMLVRDSERLSLNDTNWQECALKRLGKEGVVTLFCPLRNSSKLADALRFFITHPVESGYLSVFGRIDAIRRARNTLEADIVVEEGLQ